MSTGTTAQGFDFNGVSAPESKNYLKPGIYELKVTSAKYDAPEGKTPSLKVTFSGDEGSMTHSFWLTTKALDRLVYLHEQWFGKPIAKAFPDANAVGLYFEKAFASMKNVSKKVLVSGKEGIDGKVYADLGYANFVLGDEAPTGEFPEGSTQYNNNLKRNKDAGALATSGAIVSGGSTDDDDDMPF